MKTMDRFFDYNNLFAHEQMQLPSGNILQIAELSLIKEGEILSHIQSCDEITYAISGKATIYSGDSLFKMTAGQIHYIKQGQEHRIIADTDHHFHYCCIGFIPNPNYEDIRMFLDIIHDKNDFLVKDDGNIRTLLDLLINESFLHDDKSNTMIHFYFCQILILLYRILNGQTGKKTERISPVASNQAVYRTLKYIDRNYMKLNSVKEIAANLSYSEYYLSHIFKEKMNITIKDYLLQKKIMTATELLTQSNMSISEIVEQLNFSSLNTFGDAFKRRTHMSPTEFRRQNKLS